MATQVFEFKFTLITVKVALDDINITVKQGVRTWQAEIARLKYLYVITHPDVGLECVLSYDTVEGKTKRLRINGNFGEQQFSAMVDALVKRRPEIDIRNKPLKEAHKLMGAANLVRLAPLIVFVIAISVIGVVFLPALVHGFDSGSALVDAEVCRADCPVASRNVMLVNGYLNGEKYVQETETSDSGSRVTREFFPFVPFDWEENDPVYIVVESPPLSDSEFEDVFQLDELPAVMRDVLWEGMDGETRRVFRDEVGLTIAPEARLFEYKADPQTDLILVFIVGGVTLVICAIATIVVRRRYK